MFALGWADTEGRRRDEWGGHRPRRQRSKREGRRRGLAAIWGGEELAGQAGGQAGVILAFLPWLPRPRREEEEEGEQN